VVTQKRKLGDIGEEAAAKHLKKLGYRILERNYNRKWGEIDIVAKFKKEIVFIEVKSKNKDSRFLPAQNVNFSKQQRLIRAARSWLAENKIKPEIAWQVDVVIVELDFNERNARIKHLRNCVWG
jgi:putative endonuclease